LSLSLSTHSDNIARKPGGKAAHQDPEKLDRFWLAAVQQADFERVLLEKIAEIVRAPAWGQSIKGVFTAGFTRSGRYVIGKIGKVRREKISSNHVLLTLSPSFPTHFFARSTLRAGENELRRRKIRNHECGSQFILVH
jgi:hypothetical protein